MSEPMKIKTGAPVTGSDFFPRQAVIEALQRALQAEHVLFLAPRRTGKTSVLLQLKAQASHPAVFLDLEGFDHPKLWIEAMARHLSEIKDSPLMRKSRQLLKFLPRLENIENKYVNIKPADWEQKATQLLDELQGQQAPIWFLLDEFPIMVDHIARAHGVALASATLHWLRRCRQEKPDSPVRFLLTGSIGLDSVLRRHGIRGPANDLRRELLPPLQEPAAVELALRLAKDNQVALNASLAKEFVQRLGPARYPYFIQLFVHQLQEAVATPARPARLEDIYRSLVEGRNQYAENMWERLREIFDAPQADLARAILRQVAARDEGVESQALMAGLPPLQEADYSYVFDVLVHDGYLMEPEDGRILFYSNLLRDFWRNKGRA